MNKLFAIASLVLSFQLVGCAAQTMDGDEGAESAPPAEQTGTQESALDNVLDGLHHYKCNAIRCTCTGDIDCNDMFNSGKCGDVAQCDNSTNPSTCWCYKRYGRSISSNVGAATKLDTTP